MARALLLLLPLCSFGCAQLSEADGLASTEQAVQDEAEFMWAFTDDGSPESEATLQHLLSTFTTCRNFGRVIFVYYPQSHVFGVAFDNGRDRPPPNREHWQLALWIEQSFADARAERLSGATLEAGTLIEMSATKVGMFEDGGSISLRRELSTATETTVHQTVEFLKRVLPNAQFVFI